MGRNIKNFVMKLYNGIFANKRMNVDIKTEQLKICGRDVTFTTVEDSIGVIYVDGEKSAIFTIGGLVTKDVIVSETAMHILHANTCPHETYKEFVDRTIPKN